MDFQNNEFSKMESLKSKKITLITKTVGAFIFVSAILGIITLEIIIIESEKLSVQFKISSGILSVILLSLLVYSVLKDTIVTRENKITKVIVDQNGLHHCKDEIIIESLTFESLYPNPDLKNYDVVLSEGEDAGYDICVYYFDNSRNIIIYKAIIFNTPFSIRNGKELKRHFIKGVLKFRSDLKVSPKVLDLLNLKNL
ncbi:hypothetical protein SAMN05444671_3934 [Flavobacterium sp. CF108]|uniref:hypothetical protein n=1 Tax=unclassified Flavobacterium TaxID=196869 RepID=UPI0008D26DF0|nr:MULTISPECIES: hypothetical protein [unclassified Flavobacterium]SEO94462.1 hypothetical protein SAMN04487978_4037 [Flavobacterium sp. fv08]SHH82714.1 hypothetical protein SAMN05444671_3934 [Flavobacterium sp. CF108]